MGYIKMSAFKKIARLYSDYRLVGHDAQGQNIQISFADFWRQLDIEASGGGGQPILFEGNQLPNENNTGGELEKGDWTFLEGGETYQNIGGGAIIEAPSDRINFSVFNGDSWDLLDLGSMPMHPLTNQVSENTEKAITPKGVFDLFSEIAHQPSFIDIDFLTGYWHSSQSFVSSESYLSTQLMDVEEGEIYSFKGHKNGTPSSVSRIQVWINGVMTTTNIGHQSERTYTVPEGATKMAFIIAFGGGDGQPVSPYMNTFKAIKGANWEYHLKIDKDLILSKISIKDFFDITPNIPLILDIRSSYENHRVILENGTIAPSASNNLTSDRVEVTGGELISTSPIRAFAEYDENDNFIDGTWRGSVFNHVPHTFNLHASTRYIRATVPQDGGTGITSNLANFIVAYGGQEIFQETLVYDLKLKGGGKINVFSADTASQGTTDENFAIETIKSNNNENNILKNLVENENTINSLLSLKGTNSISKTISIPGKTELLQNHVQRLHIHWGSQRGNIQFDEVFMDENCKPDFSDLRFTDENGGKIDFLVHSYGNYEFIKDDASLLNNTIEYTSDGKLVMSHSTSGTNRNLRISTDNGGTWTILHNNVNLLYIDSRDIVFVFRHTDYKMFRLLPGESYSTLHEVLDLSDSQSDIRPLAAFCEDQNGHLFCGKYQGAWDVEIFKSTDEGATWYTVFRDLENNQHVHHISFDAYTNTLYAGLDGAKNYLDPVKRAKNIKSTDGGATWTVVPNPYPNSDYGLAFYGNGYRLGFGETSILGGPTIYKTFDDVNYYPVLNTNQGIRRIVEIDGVLFAGGNAGQAHRNAQVYMSKDEGETWETIFWEDWKDTNSAGDAVRYFSRHKTPMGETEPQTIIGGNGSYSRLRLFHGGDHHQALVFLKVGELPPTGREIQIHTDYTITYPAKTVETEFLPPNLKGHLKLNENRGSNIFDNVTGVFTKGDVEWQEEIRRFNSPYPFHRRDYLPTGIKLTGEPIKLPNNFILPDKNFSIAFFANFFGEYGSDSKFLIGDPLGVHIYYRNTGIYVSNGTNEYPCYGLEIPNIQNFYNFFTLTVTDDAIPIFKFTIGDNQNLSREMTTWDNTGNAVCYFLGAPLFSNAGCGIHSLMLFDRALTDEESRKIYFGYDVI